MAENMRIWTVFSADTGQSFVLRIPNEATVEMMQVALSEVSGIPAASQVLINESGINVRRGMRLTSPRFESPIFVFNLTAITTNEVLRRGSVDLPSLEPARKSDADIGSQHDDTEKAAQLANALQVRADEIVEATTKNSAEQIIMARALMSARSNLVGHAAHFRKKFTAFNDELSNSFKKYDRILVSCDTGFEALEKVTMPPELLGDEMAASMSESTVVQNMQSIRSYVAGALQQLKGRFSELSVSNMETSARLEVHMEMSELEPGKGSHFTKLDEYATNMAEFQTLQHELAADPQNLSAMYSNDAKLQKLMRLVFTAQEALHQEAQTRMRHISVHQSQIQKMAKTISGYKDSLQSLERYFGELEHVPHISTAFEAGLAEVRRRGQFRDAYAQLARECTDTINTLVEQEIGVRKAFAQTHGRHLPPALIPGLSEMPPTIDIEIPSFDSELPTLESSAAAEGEEDGATAEGGEQDSMEGTENKHAPASSPTSELRAIQQSLEAVRKERDAIQKSMLEAHYKVSMQESQIQSMDEVKMNNTNLEVQLGQMKQTVSRMMESLEARNATLTEVRQIMAMASSAHSSGSGPGSSCSTESNSESEHASSALLELLKSQLASQKCSVSEVERLEKENAELKAQLQQTRNESISLSGSFQMDDLMCFVRRRPSQLAGCTQAHIYEAICQQGESRWFLDPCPEEVLAEDEHPRLVMGRMVDQEELWAQEEGGDMTAFGLPEGTAYHCVQLADLKTFT